MAFIKITKNRYLAGFTVVVLCLALVRMIFPSLAEGKADDNVVSGKENAVSVDERKTPLVKASEKDGTDKGVPSVIPFTSLFYDANGRPVKNRINSVPDFSKTFPDNNDVQLEAANKYGVKPVENREEAEGRKNELVFVGANPYFHIDPLRSSIPYLVPRAAILLNDIGHAYYDSLQIKGVPLHQVIVTSVLRSRGDVRKLRGHNGNATENSCHLYGTTFDICYNRYKTVSDPAGVRRCAVRNDTLKWILSEVLRDMRDNGRCFIKYEVKQGCFHITVR